MEVNIGQAAASILFIYPPSLVAAKICILRKHGASTTP